MAWRPCQQIGPVLVSCCLKGQADDHRWTPSSGRSGCRRGCRSRAPGAVSDVCAARRAVLGIMAGHERGEMDRRRARVGARGAGFVWLGLTLVAVVGLARTLRSDRREALLAAAIGAGLTWMCLDRVPFTTRGLVAAHAWLTREGRTRALGYRDVIEEWLPTAAWALVYWDDVSVLVVRRIPEHARRWPSSFSAGSPRRCPSCEPQTSSSPCVHPVLVRSPASGTPTTPSITALLANRRRATTSWTH